MRTYIMVNLYANTSVPHNFLHINTLPLCLRTLGSRHNEVVADYQSFRRRTQCARAVGKQKTE